MNGQAAKGRKDALTRFIVYSLFGVFMFFFDLQWISPAMKSVRMCQHFLGRPI